MNVFEKARIKIAAPKKTKFDLSCRHITTSDFFQLDVPYIRHMIPGEKLSVNVNAFARLQSLTVPTFGDAELHLRAFFVPYRNVWKKWTDFITDSMHVNAYGNPEVPSVVPRFSNSTLYQLFDGTGFGINVVSADPDDAPSTYDFSYSEYSDDGGEITFVAYHWITLTADGRRVYKILRQLGYNMVLDGKAGAQGSDIYYNAIPLLCFLRLYLDYYYPSQYTNDSDFTSLMYFCEKDDNGSWYLNVNNLISIFSAIIYVNFDNDYFTSAFDRPVGPTPNGSSSYSLRDVTALNLSTTANSATVNSDNVNKTYRIANTPVLGSTSSLTSNIGISQYALNALRSLTDFLKRHQLVGERAADRFFARFGISLKDEQLNRSKYLGACRIPLVVGDVMSMADTTGAGLGDYAGKGFLVGENGTFDFEASEFGDFLICASIVPKIGYVQGMDKFTLNTTRLDFYQPEFDGLGTRAISKAEVYCPVDGDSDSFQWDDDAPVLSEDIFGFTPRYSELKMPYDRLTGDFSLQSMNVGSSSDAWHLFRLMSYNDPADIIHSKAFIQPRTHVENFNRIFANTDNSADHFTLHYQFKVASYMPAKPIYDSYDFEHDEGNEVDMRVNGGQLN